MGRMERPRGEVADQSRRRGRAARLRHARAGPNSEFRYEVSVRTIFLSVQTGMVVRDLLRCGPLDCVVSHPDVRVVLLTAGARDAAFVAEFESDRVHIVPQQPFAPGSMVWRLMTRRWRHARSPRLADA